MLVTCPPSAISVADSPLNGASLVPPSLASRLRATTRQCACQRRRRLPHNPRDGPRRPAGMSTESVSALVIKLPEGVIRRAQTNESGPRVAEMAVAVVRLRRGRQPNKVRRIGGYRPHPQLLDHRAHRSREVDARRPAARVHRRRLEARDVVAVPRRHGPGARAGHHDQGAVRSPDVQGRATDWSTCST
jgi:hypothetical protein